jgi:hypothetical protein
VMARKYAAHIGQGTLRPLGPGHWYGGPMLASRCCTPSRNADS